MKALGVLAAMTMVACAEPAPAASQDAALAAEPPASAWDVVVTEAGLSLRLSGTRAVMHLSCTRKPAMMTAVVDGFEAVGSEERLSLGVGDDPFVFVADPTAKRARGVFSQAPISPALLARLEKPGAVGAVYGAQTEGPHPAPPLALARQFADGCRRIAAETPPPAPTGVAR